MSWAGISLTIENRKEKTPEKTRRKCNYEYHYYH
jgi:hypothetical protein